MRLSRSSALLGLDVAEFFAGAIIVETIFAWPGVGSLMVQSVLARDYPVIQAGGVSHRRDRRVRQPRRRSAVRRRRPPTSRRARHEHVSHRHFRSGPSPAISRPPRNAAQTRLRIGRWLAPGLLVVSVHRVARLRHCGRPITQTWRTSRLVCCRPPWDARGSSHHLLGTDELGRDMLSRLDLRCERLLHRDRHRRREHRGCTSAPSIGIIAGYAGGWFGWLTRRMIDIETAFPFLVIALTIVAVFGASVLVADHHHRSVDVGAVCAPRPRAHAGAQRG